MTNICRFSRFKRLKKKMLCDAIFENFRSLIKKYAALYEDLKAFLVKN